MSERSSAQENLIKTAVSQEYSYKQTSFMATWCFYGAYLQAILLFVGWVVTTLITLVVSIWYWKERHSQAENFNKTLHTFMIVAVFLQLPGMYFLFWHKIINTEIFKEIKRY